MIKNYAKNKLEQLDPEQSLVDFILNYSKALQINPKAKTRILSILN